MALTVNVVKRTVFGDQRIAIADVTFDDSYDTGGELLDLQLLGLSTVHFMAISPASGYAVEWDGANKKLLARATGSANKAVFTQIDSTTDLDALTVRVMAIGN